jgi:hypothetical protein
MDVPVMDKTRLIILLAILSAKPSGSFDCFRREAERGDLLPAVANRLREGVALPEFVDQTGFLEVKMEILIESFHRLYAELGFFAPPENLFFKIGKLVDGPKEGVEVASRFHQIGFCLLETFRESPLGVGAFDQSREPRACSRCVM